MRQFLTAESPLKMMKNAFYFTVKALFVLKLFKFLSRLFCRVKKGLIRKIRLIPEFMTSQPDYQAIVMHILANILKSKSNQIMKLGQSIEYNIRNIFLEKSYTKCGGETSPRPSSRKSKLSISLDQYSKVLLNAKLRTIEIYRN